MVPINVSVLPFWVDQWVTQIFCSILSLDIFQDSLKILINLFVCEAMAVKWCAFSLSLFYYDNFISFSVCSWSLARLEASIEVNFVMSTLTLRSTYWIETTLYICIYFLFFFLITIQYSSRFCISTSNV